MLKCDDHHQVCYRKFWGPGGKNRLGEKDKVWKTYLLFNTHHRLSVGVDVWKTYILSNTHHRLSARKEIRMLACDARGKSLRPSGSRRRRDRSTSIAWAASNVMGPLTPPPSSMDPTGRSIASIAMRKVSATRPSLSTRVGWTQRQSWGKTETRTLAHDAVEKFSRRKNVRRKSDPSTATASPALSAPGSSILSPVARVPMERSTAKLAMQVRNRMATKNILNRS